MKDMEENISEKEGTQLVYMVNLREKGKGVLQ